ncbi:DUF3224 domain-containing protein [Roseibium sp. M-1]
MKAAATCSAGNFRNVDMPPAPSIATAYPVSVTTMEKRYCGDIEGRSATVFTAAFDEVSGRGCYLAMESFEGAINGREGTFNFIHSASTTGRDRSNDFFRIVDGSGTGNLEGLSG